MDAGDTNTSIKIKIAPQRSHNTRGLDSGASTPQVLSVRPPGGIGKSNGKKVSAEVGSIAGCCLK